MFGRPAPQGSKDLGGAGQLREQSAYLPAWRRAVKIAAYRAYQLGGIDPASLPLFPAGTAVTISALTFIVGPDQCRAEGTDEPLGTPDVDKLLRATLDPLGGGKPWNKTARLYRDDSQVWRIVNLCKVRSTSEQRPGAIIIIDGRH